MNTRETWKEIDRLYYEQSKQKPIPIRETLKKKVR